ncbi:protein O14 [Mandrillus leucophaeus cytomegalovirus]|uniref:Protein O14 n=1 Tax=Mandrillus leucophaeus cytomegalovirus TaxID=1654930 RepID=A0A0G2ULY6_9BETA|nr:protein O14 [Mandrillus leucophaeus cytomegalovirus]AKI29742.1 protein O14 [Mandrillus leucophaeus cytomegalovirus]
MVCSEIGVPETPPSLPERLSGRSPESMTMEQRQNVTSAVATELAVSFPSVTPEMTAVIEAAVRSTLRILATAPPAPGSSDSGYHSAMTPRTSPGNHTSTSNRCITSYDSATPAGPYTKTTPPEVHAP